MSGSSRLRYLACSLIKVIQTSKITQTHFTARLTFMHSDKKFEQLNKKEKESTLGAIKSFTLNTIRDPLEKVGLQASSIEIKSIDSNKKVQYVLVSQKYVLVSQNTFSNVIPTCVPCNRRKMGLCLFP